MEGAITGTAVGRGKGSKEFGVVREGAGLGGKELKEGEELGLEAISEGGVPVKRWGRGYTLEARTSCEKQVNSRSLVSKHRPGNCLKLKI